MIDKAVHTDSMNVFLEVLDECRSWVFEHVSIECWWMKTVPILADGSAFIHNAVNTGIVDNVAL